jgi:hypothetical protein
MMSICAYFYLSFAAAFLMLMVRSGLPESWLNVVLFVV